MNAHEMNHAHSQHHLSPGMNERDLKAVLAAGETKMNKSKNGISTAVRAVALAAWLGASVPAQAIDLVVGNNKINGVDIREVTLTGTVVTLRLAPDSAPLRAGESAETPTTPTPPSASGNAGSCAEGGGVICSENIPTGGEGDGIISLEKDNIIASKIVLGKGVNGVMITYLGLKDLVDVWVSPNPGDAPKTLASNPYQKAYCNRLNRGAHPSMVIRLSALSKAGGACLVPPGTYYINQRLSESASASSASLSRQAARTQ